MDLGPIAIDSLYAVYFDTAAASIAFMASVA